MKKLVSEFQAAIDAGLFPLFEVEVIDRRTGETEYIVADVSINGDRFIAQHVGMNTAQDKGDKIAFTAIDIDEDFSLCENLQELFSAFVEAIYESEFFELID